MKVLWKHASCNSGILGQQLLSGSLKIARYKLRVILKTTFFSARPINVPILSIDRGEACIFRQSVYQEVADGEGSNLCHARSE